MKRSPFVCVVMLAYNECEHTLRAIDSVRRMTYPHFELLLVDNRSTDETVTLVRERYPDVILISNEENLGFAAGSNVGIQAALSRGADYVLCINNDVTVDTSMLDKLVEAMKPGVGAASPLVYDLDCPDRIWSSGFRRHPLLLESRGGAKGERDPGAWPRVMEVDYLDGCAMFFPRRVLEEVGFFDPRYFFYYEDRDLSTRIQAQGDALIVVPGAKLWHKGAASSGTGTPFQVYQLARSSVIYFRQHTRGWQRPASFLFRLGSAIKKSGKFLLMGQIQLLRQHWRGLRDGWRVPTSRSA